MRHAQAFRPGTAPDEREPGSALTTAGVRGAAAVGSRLADSLSDDQIDLAGVTVACAPTSEARETAAVLTGALGASRPPVELDHLAPKCWARRSEQSSADRWKLIESDLSELPGGKHAVILVGHDPQMSWLLHYLVELGGGGQRGAGSLPLGRGEMAMLAGPRGKPRLRYVLTPSDEDLIKELQNKIRSKMDSAKLLGAFLTALLFFAAREVASAEIAPTWQPWVGGIGLVLLAMATAAYFVTMFQYDALLMPVRMWPSPREPDSRLPRGFAARPPSSSAWVLYQNMMRVWSFGFIPATLLAGGGGIAVTVALAEPHDLGWVAVAVAVAAVAAVTMATLRFAQPNLGVSD